MKKLLIPASIVFPMLLGYCAQLVITYSPEDISMLILRFVLPLIALPVWYYVGKAFSKLYYSPLKASLIAHSLGLYCIAMLLIAQLGAPLPIDSHLLSIAPQMYYLPLLALASGVINPIAAAIGMVFKGFTIYLIFHYTLILCIMLLVFHLGFKKQAKKYTIFL